MKKIRTKGFLGHLSGEAENDFVELDFADKNLWLIQGSNGAGKSTLFDAITMAFYRQHRGGASNFAKLIHDKADKAEIFIEFALHGNDYQVTVDLPRKSTVTRSVKFWNGVNWATKNDDVDDWVKQNLKISYKTFVSSVLLRQGGADKFISEEPTPRRKIFLELLQLEIYTKLTEKARERQRLVNIKLRELKQKLEGLENPSATEIKNQEREVRGLGKELEILEKDNSAKQKEFDNAKQAQKLKAQIEEIKAQQIRDEVIFAKATQVEEKYCYFIELKESLLQIENVWREKNELLKIEKDFESSVQKITQLNSEQEIISDNLTKYLTDYEKAKSEFLEIETHLSLAKSESDKLKQMLDEIARIENLESQISEASRNLQEIRFILAETKEQLTELENQANEKISEREKLTAHLLRCSKNVHIWSDRLENRQKVLDKDECPTCGNELKRDEVRLKLTTEYEEAERKVEEFKQENFELNGNLSDTNEAILTIKNQLKSDKAKLQELLISENGFKTKIETCQSQIITFYTDEEREKNRQNFSVMKNQIADFESKFQVAKENTKNIRTNVEKWEKLKTQNESNLKNHNQYLNSLDERKKQTEINLIRSQSQISDKWQNHPSLLDETELNNLRRNKDDLRNIEIEHKNLGEARNRQVIFKTQIEGKTKELEEIPQIHWREISEVQMELNEIVEKIKAFKAQFSVAEENCRKMTADKKLYDEKSVEMKSVKEDFEIWKKLVKALGKDGLETKVVHEAKTKISENANKTLKALSNGKFQLELEDSGKEMKIFVRDFTTGEQRQVEYCSGGEKFLTAVSLAVAIGQSASGQNIANTLIIDEGFGALDDKNRVLMVNELSRLTDIFQNGRVIIVSHQDDVQESFANRYRLTKNDEGFTSVETGAVL
ncbi:MAG TPA: SMC family ATPase [Pyrinomonadaceae bacterium]|nr:SMC family ATPase [Pyrinomonadaceae bacterium]